MEKEEKKEKEKEKSKEPWKTWVEMILIARDIRKEENLIFSLW